MVAAFCRWVERTLGFWLFLAVWGIGIWFVALWAEPWSLAWKIGETVFAVALLVPATWFVVRVFRCLERMGWRP